MITLAGELRGVISLLIRRAREQTPAGDLTVAQKTVILRLERDGAGTVSMLAKAEGVRHQSMRVTIAALQRMGFVAGTADPADGRQTIVKLTSSGLKTLKAGRAAKDDWLFRALQAQLTPQERNELVAAVGLLRRISEF